MLLTYIVAPGAYRNKCLSREDQRRIMHSYESSTDTIVDNSKGGRRDFVHRARTCRDGLWLTSWVRTRKCRGHAACRGNELAGRAKVDEPQWKRERERERESRLRHPSCRDGTNRERMGPSIERWQFVLRSAQRFDPHTRRARESRRSNEERIGIPRWRA